MTRRWIGTLVAAAVVERTTLVGRHGSVCIDMRLRAGEKRREDLPALVQQEFEDWLKRR